MISDATGAIGNGCLALSVHVARYEETRRIETTRCDKPGHIQL